MMITITYELDNEMLGMIEDILSWYEPSDFKNQDDRDVYIIDIAQSLMDIYPPQSWEEIIAQEVVEKILREKGWIE